MRILTRWWSMLAVLAIVGCVTHALAQDKPAQADDAAKQVWKLVQTFLEPQPQFGEQPSLDSPNAAARYLKLSPSFDTDLAYACGWLVDTQATFELDPKHPEGVTLDSIRTRLEARQNEIRALIEASKLDQYDFRLSQSPAAADLAEDDPRRLRLGSMRRSLGVLRADALRLWSLGERDAAIDRAAAMLRICRQLGNEKSGLLASKSAAICFHKLQKMISNMTSKSPLSVPQAAELLGILKEMNAADPLRTREEWRRERDSLLDFAAAELAEGSSGTRLYIVLGQFRGVTASAEATFNGMKKRAKGEKNATTDVSPEELRKLARDMLNATPEVLRERLAEARDLAGSLDAAWDQPEADELYKKVSKSIDGDKTGLLGMTLGHPWGVRFDWKQAVDDHRSLLASLQRRKVPEVTAPASRESAKP